MKILWFSNTPANADEYFNSELKGTGGWLKALDKEMQNKVELHIAFYTDFYHTFFKYRKTHYYPINRFKNKFEKIRMRLLNIEIKEKDTKKYLAVVNKVKPDLIHIHGTENPFVWIISKIKIPVIVSIQGNNTVCYHKFFSGIEKHYMKYWKNSYNLLLGNSLKNTLNRFVWIKEIEQRSLRYCKYIIGRTDWDKRITRVLAPKSRYYHSDEILRNGFYNKEWSNPQNNNYTVFTTSGNTIYKGFETLCETLFLLNELENNVNWKVAGISKNDPIVKIVKRKLGNKYPTKNLNLLGKLNVQELINELLSSNLYVMPSHIENSPNNLCEAMILGMPCLATHAGGTGSLLTDGKDGVLIQDGDPWSMAGAIIEMKENYSNAIKMGNKARVRALKRHDKTKIIDNLLKIYIKISNDKNKI